MFKDSGGGGKHIATTARKSKPDGSHELMHRVEHHFDPIPYMKKMKPVGERKVHVQQPNPHNTDKIHAMITGHSAQHPRHDSQFNLQHTIEALRKMNMNSINDMGGFAGDGRLERQAPGLQLPRATFEDGSGMSLNHPFAAGNAETNAPADTTGPGPFRPGWDADPWRFIGRSGSQA
jgi:hypothetical protein